MAADATNHIVARMVLTYLYDNNMQDLAEQFWNRNVFLSKAVPSAVLARMVSIGRLTNVIKEHTELISILNDFWKTYMAPGCEKVFMTPSGKATILVDMCKSLLSFIPTEAPIQFLSEPVFGESEQGTSIVLMEEGNVNLNEFPIEFDPSTLQVITDEAETQNRVDQSEQKENIDPILIEIPGQPETVRNAEMPVTTGVPAVTSPIIPPPSAEISPDLPTKKRRSERSAIKLKRLHNAKRARFVSPRSASKSGALQGKVKNDLPKRSAGRITTTIKSASQNRLNSITAKASKKDTIRAQLHNESSSSSTATMSPESDEGIRQMTDSLQKHRRSNRRFAQKQTAEPQLSNTVQSQFRSPEVTSSITSKTTETNALNSASKAAVSTLLQTTNVGEDTISAVLAHIHGKETSTVNHPECYARET